MIPGYDDLHAMLTAPGQMFEIEEAAIAGVRTPVWKNAPRSLAAVLESSVQHGAREFLVFGEERLDFVAHHAKVVALANRLVTHFGVRKGERVAIAMRNFPEWSIAFWAITAIGAVAVPLNAWWTADELGYGLADSGAVLLFADEERAARVRTLEPGPALRALIVARAARLPSGCLDFAAVLAQAPADATLPRVVIEPEDPATLFYTSGTTGLPKGALGSHRNICSNVLSLSFVKVRSVFRAGGGMEDLLRARQKQESYLLTVPFFHVTGCHGILLSMLAFGGKIVLTRKWDPDEALALIERERITTFGGVPTMAWQLIEAQRRNPRDTSSVGAISYGGAPAAPELLRRLGESFPQCSAANGYGLTECSGMVTLNSGSDYQRKPESAGVPVPVCRVIAVDADGRELPRGELGELWVAGPNVVHGYWNKPDATAKSFTAGWFHTGDIGRVDEEGYVYVVDRLKDMIIRGGENVYCAEVEGVLVEHPAVRAAAVIGVPHEVLGEEVGAVVHVECALPPSEAELRAHVGARLAAFKVPSRIWFRGEPLPLGATGKVQKRELREQVLANP